MDEHAREKAIGQMKDLLGRFSAKNEPFLFFFPQLLMQPAFKSINPEKALEFVKLATQLQSQPLIQNALLILNKLIHSDDGNLVRPEPIMFYNNRSFMWNELGGHTDTVSVITHILNKTLFQMSLGKSA